MRTDNKDILQSLEELKEMPYSVPEGYFSKLQEDIMGRCRESGVKAEGKAAPMAAPCEAKPAGLMQKLAPYLAIAAMFIFIVTAGTFFLRHTSEDKDYTYEDYLVMSGSLAELVKYEEMNMDEADQEEIKTEDIANYLIYTGTAPNDFELLYE